MTKTKTQAEAPDKARSGPTLQKQAEPPEKKFGPSRVVQATTSALPPPNGKPAAARAANLMMASEPGSGGVGRARLMRAMQGKVGNTRLSRMLGATVQAKLTVGAPDDVYEQEVDRVADTVMRMPEPLPAQANTVRRQPEAAGGTGLCPECEKKLQRQVDEEETAGGGSASLQRAISKVQLCPDCARTLRRQMDKEELETAADSTASEEISPAAPDEAVQRQPETEEPEATKEDEETSPAQGEADSLISRQSVAGGVEPGGQTPQVDSGTESYLNASSGGGQSLSDSSRAFMEPRFGQDFSGVRVHTDSRAANAAKGLNAQAFTHGQDIYFGEGRYQPGTPQGQRLLGHELTHVIQQNGEIARDLQREHTTSTVEAGPSEAEGSLPARPARSAHEIVLMSGGPTSHRRDPEHDANPLNYATAARIRIERLMESAFGDQRLMIPDDRITWVVMRPPYRYRALEDNKDGNAYIDLIQNSSLPRLQAAWNRLASVSGNPRRGSDAIRLHFVDNSADFVDFINEGSGDARAAMRVGRFEYFGHGLPGQLWFTMGWEHLGDVNRSFSIDDIRSLDSKAFISEGEYRSWSCNTATPPGINKDSFVQAWVERMGGRFVGAVGRTTYEYIIHQSEVRLSSGSYTTPEGVTRPAYWTTTQAVGNTAMGPSPAPTTPSAPVTPETSAPISQSDPNWVHESELPLDEGLASTAPAEGPAQTDLTAIDEQVSSSMGASTPETEAQDLVCQAEVVPLSEPASPGDLICTPEGAGRLNLDMCIPEEEDLASSVASAPTTSIPAKSPGTDYHYIHQIYIEDPGTLFAPDASNPAWHPFLQEIANRAYHETLDTDSAPGTGSSMITIASEVRARSRGFYIGVVERNGRVYYTIYGSRGARTGIPGRWYAARNLPGTSAELGRLVNPRVGLGAGLRSGSLGLGGALTVAGTTLDYAIDPEKEFGTDYAVDLSLDLVKSAGAGAAGGVAGAAVTGWLAGGAMGATIGSAAPVVGTVIGFVVGVLAAMAIEYFIEDYRSALKAWLRGRHDIRSDRGGSSGRGDGK